MNPRAPRLKRHMYNAIVHWDRHRSAHSPARTLLLGQIVVAENSLKPLFSLETRYSKITTLRPAARRRLCFGDRTGPGKRQSPPRPSAYIARSVSRCASNDSSLFDPRQSTLTRHNIHPPGLAQPSQA